MKKKKFHSQLFRREILPDEKDYFAIVEGELLYRINDMQIKNCSCMQCSKELDEYKITLAKIEKLRRPDRLPPIDFKNKNFNSKD